MSKPEMALSRNAMMKEYGMRSRVIAPARVEAKAAYLPGFESYPTTQYIMALSRSAMMNEYGMRNRVVGMAYAQPG